MLMAVATAATTPEPTTTTALVPAQKQASATPREQQSILCKVICDVAAC